MKKILLIILLGLANFSQAQDLKIPYFNKIKASAAANGVPLSVALTTISIKSNFDPNYKGTTPGSHRVCGIMQLYWTGKGLNDDEIMRGCEDVDLNLRAGMPELADTYKGNNYKKMNTIEVSACGFTNKRVHMPHWQKKCLKKAKKMFLIFNAYD